jgi:hypothetical protein
VSELNQRSLATFGELADEPVEQTGPMSDFVYVDISSIDREAKKITEAKALTLSQAPSRAKQLLRTGDVLVSMTRPNLNAVALVPEQLDGAIGSTGFHVLRSRWLRPEFLHRLVQSQRFVDEMSALVQGVLYPASRCSKPHWKARLQPSGGRKTPLLNPARNCWTSFCNNAAPAGKPSNWPSSRNKVKLRPRTGKRNTRNPCSRTPPICRNCRRGGCGRVGSSYASSSQRGQRRRKNSTLMA